jgi:sporulation protein YlmC with PRC-barrel domain
MRLKEIRGLPVIDPIAARKIGTVLDYQIDPVAGRLAALDINGIEEGATERILSQRVRRVGRSAVILTDGVNASPRLPIEDNERWLDSETFAGLEVMGDDGNRVGRLADGAFNQDNLAMELYVLRVGWFARLFGNRGRVVPSTVYSCSREMMLVTTGRAAKELSLDSAVEQATPALGAPLKSEDRAAAQGYDSTPESTPVAARTL